MIGGGGEEWVYERGAATVSTGSAGRMRGPDGEGEGGG